MANKVQTIKTEYGCEITSRVTLYLSYQEYLDLFKVLTLVLVPDYDSNYETVRSQLLDRLSESEKRRLSILMCDIL